MFSLTFIAIGKAAETLNAHSSTPTSALKLSGAHHRHPHKMGPLTEGPRIWVRICPKRLFSNECLCSSDKNKALNPFLSCLGFQLCANSIPGILSQRHSPKKTWKLWSERGLSVIYSVRALRIAHVPLSPFSMAHVPLNRNNVYPIIELSLETLEWNSLWC